MRKLPLVEWTCETCGKECFINRAQMTKARKLRFCSQTCANIGNRGEGNPAWRGGHKKYYGKDWRPLQRLARKLDDNTCQRCGITKKQINRNLDVHHLNPVVTFENPNDANYIENVVTLCHPCHSTVEWNIIDFTLPKRCETQISKQPHLGNLFEEFKI
ncbi:MAG: HNH endonuclease [Thermodesulfobacteriota bacterium]